MAKRITRDRHAAGVQIPAIFETGHCFRGHDITIEANIQLHIRAKPRTAIAIRCGMCKRAIDSNRPDRVAATIQPRICDECRQPYLPNGPGGLTSWSRRRYCGRDCGQAAVARRHRTHRTSLTHLRPAPGWQHTGACRDDDPELWFATDVRHQAEARNICNRYCPVQRQCLDHALAVGETKGIWGGMTADQREKLRRRLKKGEAA